MTRRRTGMQTFWQVIALVLTWSICVAIVDMVSEITSEIYEAW